MKWKWIAYPFAFIALVILLVGMVGSMVKRRYEVTVSGELNTSPQKIYQILTDVDAYLSWRSDLKTVDRVADRDGRLGWIESSNFGRSRIEVEENVPNQYLVARIMEGDSPFEGARVIVLSGPEAGPTTVTITDKVEIANPFIRFTFRFLVGQKTGVETCLRDLSRKVGS